MVQKFLKSTDECGKKRSEIHGQTFKTSDRIRGEFNLKQEDWRDAKRIYDTFKKLRASMGKPVVNRIDPKKARKDLSGTDFFQTY